MQQAAPGPHLWPLSLAWPPLGRMPSRRSCRLSFLRRALRLGAFLVLSRPSSSVPSSANGRHME